MKTILLFLIFSIAPLTSHAISPEEVVASSLKHSPKVIEALQNVIEKESKVSESSGAFDAKIKSKMNLRTEGFYSGDIYKAEIEKVMPFANSKFYAGGRQSFGDFPSYEGKFKTQTAGEVFAGFSLSLLRGFSIDANRYSLKQSQQDLLQSKLKAEKVKITIQTMALKSYWTWVIKGHELSVFNNILNLAKSRARKISKRIKAGDLARIYGVENDQYIKKWESEAIRSEMEFVKSAYYLSLFFRDKTGRPITPIKASLPKLESKALKKLMNLNKVYNKALNSDLFLQKLNSQKEQADLDVQMGKNFLMPKLDLNLELSQDNGSGAADLNESESRVMLNFEIPLQFRKGKGKMRAGKAKIASLKTQQLWTSDKLLVETKSLMLKLNSFSDLYKITAEQVKLSEKLAAAERKKFFRGASDLILVNLRDENLAQAQIKNLSSRLKYQFVDAEIRNLLVEFIPK